MIKFILFITLFGAFLGGIVYTLGFVACCLFLVTLGAVVAFEEHSYKKDSDSFWEELETGRRR